MKILTTIGRRLVSSKKFYDIVRQKKEQIIPKTAEEVIISKYLKENATYIRNSKPNEEQNIEKPVSKSVNYQQIIRENPSGSIVEMNHKDIRLHLLSLNYHNISLSDIHQLFQKVEPDLVFVQARPEPYIKDFELLPKADNCFSDVKYLNQLCVTQKVIKSSFLPHEIAQKLKGILGVANKSDLKVYIHDNKDLLDDDVVMISGYYCATNRQTLLFGELPEQPWREWLCNSHTLMELQEIFKHICKNIPFYESLKLTPYRLAVFLRPDIFLNMRDRYMATLIEMAIASKKYKNIFCVMGLGENQAVEQLLANNWLIRGEGEESEITPVIQYLVGPEIKHSILRNTEGWQIIEKHIILDLLQHGEQILSQPLHTFTTTNKIIDYYGKKLNEYPDDVILQFRYDKTMSYLQQMRHQISEGAQLKRKFMLREALRSPSADM